MSTIFAKVFFTWTYLLVNPLAISGPSLGLQNCLVSEQQQIQIKIIPHSYFRCCLVYSCRSLRENTKVAVKFFKRGPHYDGAVQREQYILETLGADPKNNIGKNELKFIIF